MSSQDAETIAGLRAEFETAKRDVERERINGQKRVEHVLEVKNEEIEAEKRFQMEQSKIIHQWRDAAKKAEAQLPVGMKDCSIVFINCHLGHGWLTAKNWTDTGCPACRAEKAESSLAAVRAELEKLKSDNDSNGVSRLLKKALEEMKIERSAADKAVADSEYRTSQAEAELAALRSSSAEEVERLKADVQQQMGAACQLAINERALSAQNVALREALLAKIQLEGRGGKPRKLDEALAWIQNDEKAERMAREALALSSGGLD